MNYKTKRTFEPPARVYKKCRNDVIVVAEIPKDAYVRGHEGYKCRASKAKIVEIIDVDGMINEEIFGISYWDPTTTYWVGDEIEIEDFDYSDNECSTGFHFFCYLEEALAYRFWIVDRVVSIEPSD